MPGAQYLGDQLRTRLAVVPSAGGLAGADAIRLAEEFRHDGLTAPGAAPPDTPLAAAAEGIAISGAGVAVSVVRAREDGTQVRLVAMSQQPTTAVVTGPFGSAVRTDLLGRPLEDLSVDGADVSVSTSAPGRSSPCVSTGSTGGIWPRVRHLLACAGVDAATG